MRKWWLAAALVLVLSLTVMAQAGARPTQLAWPGLPGPPDAPSNLTVDSASTSAVSLSWSDNASSETGFSLERKEANGTYTEIATPAYDTTSYIDNSVSAGTYYYRLRAYNFLGYSDYSNEVSVNTSMQPAQMPAPATPSNLQAQATSPTQIDLSWDDVNFETGYRIEYRNGASWSVLTTVAPETTSFASTGLDPSSTYDYRVQAYNLFGDSGYSNEASATTLAQPNPPAATPTNLQANAISPTEINITWVDVGNETAYRLVRKSSGNYSVLTTLGADVTSFDDTGLNPATTYTYMVQAKNQAGTSSFSNEASATTLAQASPPQPPLPPPGQVTLQLYIGSQTYYVNDAAEHMDTTPIILNGRTLLPIRYVAQPLGATVEWDGADQKVTVTLNNTIAMWIGSNQARVNGTPTPIDPGNSSVTPIIRDGRTLLPIRFISENLGCDVYWNGAQQEVEIVYPAQP